MRPLIVSSDHRRVIRSFHLSGPQNENERREKESPATGAVIFTLRDVERRFCVCVCVYRASDSPSY